MKARIMHRITPCSLRILPPVGCFCACIHHFLCLYPCLFLCLHQYLCLCRGACAVSVGRGRGNSLDAQPARPQGCVARSQGTRWTGRGGRERPVVSDSMHAQPGFAVGPAHGLRSQRRCWARPATAAAAEGRLAARRRRRGPECEAAEGRLCSPLLHSQTEGGLLRNLAGEGRLCSPLFRRSRALCPAPVQAVSRPCSSCAPPLHTAGGSCGGGSHSRFLSLHRTLNSRLLSLPRTLNSRFRRCPKSGLHERKLQRTKNLC